ncbi:MAG: isochorismatase family protein [Gammaproteobacteria bacterium]
MTEDDLHGNAPDSAGTALLIVDVINDLEFPGADRLFESARDMATHLAELKARAGRARIPCIYVNDNFGRWRSSLETLVSHCLESNVRGKAIVQMLRPTDSDYFILKPKHSGFYFTPLHPARPPGRQAPDHHGPDRGQLRAVHRQRCLRAGI